MQADGMMVFNKRNQQPRSFPDHAAGGAAMKGITGIILRVGTVLFGTAAYALIGMAIAAAG
jgi:hypothetical protein